jgi:YgiT-type zinc finger domain-containing protein
MHRGTAPFSMDRKGYQIRWNAVPAWTCSQCGEPYFEAAEVEAIQRALTLLDEQSIGLTSAA